MDLNALADSLPAFVVWVGGNWTWRPVFKSYPDELRFEWLALTATVMT